MKICFTGHRPNKLGGYDWGSPKNLRVRLGILRIVEDIIMKNQDGKEFHFIFGGALGVDQMAFDIVKRYEQNVLIRDNIRIFYEYAIPFKDQPNAWFKQEDKDRYLNQIEQSDIITYVDELEKYKKTKTPIGQYNAYKLQIRNEYMVDNSDLVIAVWDGSKGGTANCVNYAKKINKKIIQINPSDF